MAFELTVREVGDVTIIDTKGSLSLGDGTTDLRKLFEKLRQDGKREIILNLTETDYIDSSGIGEIVDGCVKNNNGEGRMVLLGVANRVKSLIELTKLYTVFPIFDEEDKAVQSFK